MKNKTDTTYLDLLVQRNLEAHVLLTKLFFYATLIWFGAFIIVFTIFSQ